MKPTVTIELDDYLLIKQKADLLETMLPHIRSIKTEYSEVYWNTLDNTRVGGKEYVSMDEKDIENTLLGLKRAFNVSTLR